MKIKRILICLAHVAFFFLAVLAVMLLWNCIMPSLFGLTIINYCQTLGLLILTHMLFGSFGRCHGYGMMCCRHRKFNGCWRGISHEQREKYIRLRRARMNRYMKDWRIDDDDVVSGADVKA